MADLLRKLGAFLAALALVVGAIAVLGFLAKLAGGDVTARGAIGFVLGAGIVAAYEGLADQHHVRAALGVLDDVVRAADARLGDLDDSVGDAR